MRIGTILRLWPIGMVALRIGVILQPGPWRRVLRAAVRLATGAEIWAGRFRGGSAVLDEGIALVVPVRTTPVPADGKR